jgi:hypothetical protein
MPEIRQEPDHASRSLWSLADVVEGLVESTNDRGVRVQGEWRNVSKFHPVDLPDRGARVRVSLDPKGFIRSLEILDQAPPTAGSPSPGRDREIRRMCAIKVAANVIGQFAQCREEVKTEHIFPLADRILDWLEQEPPQ